MVSGVWGSDLGFRFQRVGVFGFRGVRVLALGFRICDSAFRVLGSGFSGQCFQGLGSDLGLRFQGV